tara:strand:- start:640 stop:960 length:321 start_codon:yes stop_codon:yes gene_type:complete
MPLTCLETDLDAVFASSDFGEADGAVRNGDTANPILGIFDDEDVESQNGEGMTVLIPQVTFTCASSKVPDPVEGDTFLIRSVLYTLRFWKDDGVGTIELFFERPDA